MGQLLQLLLLLLPSMPMRQLQRRRPRRLPASRLPYEQRKNAPPLLSTLCQPSNQPTNQQPTTNQRFPGQDLSVSLFVVNSMDQLPSFIKQKTRHPSIHRSQSHHQQANIQMCISWRDGRETNREGGRGKERHEGR
mmetsp:Transcript_24463/g.70590  ORF Transcript_24463/g.70590 Transcript_24463/m.70590 type:complete len:136 (+) Transcript_24463:759-1166(+)